MTSPTTTLTGRSPARRAAAALWVDLSGYAVFWALIQIGLVVVMTVVAAVLGEVDNSVWLSSFNFSRWIPFTGGIIFPIAYLRLFAAHGIARRDVLLAAGPVLVGLMAVLGVVAAVVLAIENAVHGALGWEHTATKDPDQFLFAHSDQYPLVAVATAAALLAYFISGSLIGAVFGRWGPVGGIALLPVGIVPALAAELLSVSWFGVTDRFGLPQPPVAVALAVLALVCAAGGLLAAAFLRDLPLGNDNLEWWR